MTGWAGLCVSSVVIRLKVLCARVGIGVCDGAVRRCCIILIRCGRGLSRGSVIRCDVLATGGDRDCVVR